MLLGTGNEGKLLKVQAGNVSVLAETKALAVTSLANAWGGSVVLGTLPAGKVMKWDRGKLADLATLPGAQHVFALAFDAKNNALYAATGPEGKLFRLSANGTAQVYFDAEEQHLMSVAVGPDGSVYAGSSDKRTIQGEGPGRGSVLYDFGRTEVRAISVAANGEVYAIANELKSGFNVPARPGKNQDTTPAGPTQSAAKAKGKGTLYRFGTDGRPERLYDSDDEHLTSLSLGDDGRVYVGTGAEGRVYSVDASSRVALVADVDERQIGALVLNGTERLIAASDPAVLHPVRGVGGADAIWTSKVFDAGLRAKFGRISWEATGAIEVSTRTGNTKEPDDTWSAWSREVAEAGPVASPPGRFFQVRARFARNTPPSFGAEVAFVTDNLGSTVTT